MEQRTWGSWVVLVPQLLVGWGLVAGLSACSGVMCPGGVSATVDGRCVEGQQPSADVGVAPTDAGAALVDAVSFVSDAAPVDGSRDAGTDAAPSDASATALADVGPMELADGGALVVDAAFAPDAAIAPDACIAQRTYADVDGDGHGDPADARDTCPEAGRVLVGGDCDDRRATVHPGATETCDNLDEDCDGAADEGLAITRYADRDGDGYGGTEAVVTCQVIAGTVTVTGDCDDACATCRPGGTESCDGRDQDCDTRVDEGVTTRVYRDADGDGVGSSTAPTLDVCTAPVGYATLAGDCNDGRSDVSPQRAETCSGVDENCDGRIDETFACVRGQTTSCTTSCGSSGTRVCSSTCELPAACTAPVETCNGIDDDCDGRVDEALGSSGTPLEYGASEQRIEVVRTSVGTVTFYVRGRALYARRADTLGNLVGTETTIVGGSVAEFAVGTYGDRITIAYTQGVSLYALALSSDLSISTARTTISSDAAVVDFATHIEVVPAASNTLILVHDGADIRLFVRSATFAGTSAPTTPMRLARPSFDAVLSADTRSIIVAWSRNAGGVALTRFSLTGAYVAEDLSLSRVIGTAEFHRLAVSPTSRRTVALAYSIAGSGVVSVVVFDELVDSTFAQRVALTPGPSLNVTSTARAPFDITFVGGRYELAWTRGTSAGGSVDVVSIDGASSNTPSVLGTSTFFRGEGVVNLSIAGAADGRLWVSRAPQTGYARGSERRCR